MDIEEERRLLAQAMACAESGEATHWPTVAGYLADEVKQLRTKLGAYEAGASFEPTEEGAELTAAQLWGKLLGASVHTRQTIIGQAMRNADLARACFAQDHAGRLGNLEYELQDVQAKLGTALGFDTPQPLHALIVAVQALKNIMVEGIAAREPAVTYATAEDFPVETGAREKIGEAFKQAGIDLQSICNYDWETVLDEPDSSICTDHVCGLVNPLHAEAHECRGCGATLTHEAAEKLEMAK
jgi:hypothetical protein